MVLFMVPLWLLVAFDEVDDPVVVPSIESLRDAVSFELAVAYANISTDPPLFFLAVILLNSPSKNSSLLCASLMVT